MKVGVSFEVCSVCQYSCAHCAHSGLKALDPRYQMSMEDLESFIRISEESDYTLDLYMHGPGEPLLWKHLTKGLTRLRESKAVEAIVINSNGLMLPRVTHILDLVDQVHISLYPGSRLQIVEHPKVVYNEHPLFLNKQFPAPLPCTCLCSGPMIYKDMVFPHCGPPLFDAVQRMEGGRDALSFGVKLARNYAEVKKTSGTFPECAYCWSNSNCQYLVEAHSTTDS